MPDKEADDLGQVDELEIRFDADPAVYREGDSVTGMLHIKNSNDVKYKAVHVELCGFAVVRWNLTEGGDTEDLVDSDKLKGDYNKEQYFYKKITLLEKEGAGSFVLCPVSSEGGCKNNRSALLTAGEYDLPFEFKLPPELPSSFEGQYGQVRYLARGCIQRQAKTNVLTRKAFTVLSGLDLNFIPEAACKIEICKYKPIGTCCTSGSVVIDWTVGRSGYVPGENICINGAVQNESKATVAYSKVTLFMVIEYKSKKGRRKERRKIAMADKDETLPGDVTVWHDTIHIPPLPPTGIGRSIIIDINYELEFKALIEGYPTPIVFTKELYIGTVPMSRKEMRSCIAGMFNQPYVESVKSSTSEASLTQILVAASAQAPKTLPTAPSLDAMERLESEKRPTEALLCGESEKQKDGSGAPVMQSGEGTPLIQHRPPPYAPGYSDLTFDPNPAAPSAPSATTLIRPWPDHIILTDPTFESSAIFGPVSLREPADDSQSLRGELVYHPVYAYFGTLPPGARPLHGP